MLKDVVLNLPLNADDSTTIDYAISLASSFGARITGVAFVYEKMPSGILGDERWIDGLEQLRKEAEDAADAAMARFENAARTVGVAAETRRIATTFSGTADTFGRIARRFDLSVVQQAEPNSGTSDHLIIQAALFDSGHPVLIVPAVRKVSAKFDRLLICWDGSRNAARAVGDAFPFLQHAKAVEIITIGDRAHSEGVSGPDLAHHLSVHGLSTVTNHFEADLDVPKRILSQAAESGADLVVMGGYGHSRLREFVLGGATRGVLGGMSIPTLMSH